MNDEMNLLTKGNQSYRILTAFSGEENSIYHKMVRKEKLFPNMFHFFALGLVYGILHKKKSTKPKKYDVIRIEQIPDENIRDIIDICYMILNDGREENEIVKEMLEYADGGVEELYKIFEKNGSFQLPILIEDSKEIWIARVKELSNINLENL